MKVYNVVKLKFLTPLHIGTGKENYDFSSSELHSDTLAAALVAIKAQTSSSDNLDGFLSTFRLSSAFPFAGNAYYLPRPMGMLGKPDKGKETLRKRLKAVKYMESGIWNDYVQGISLDIEESAIHGAFLHKGTMTQPYTNQVMQRVVVPRCDNADADPFFFEWRFFQKDAGLYCITDAEGGLFDELLQLFEQLGELGIGTDRNVGGGKFEVEAGIIELPEVAEANASIILSLYLPAEEELPNLSLETSRYNLILRGGYMAGSDKEEYRHLWKKNVYMFDVGSVFNTTKPIDGKIADLRPDWNEPMHPVYRSGKPFCLPIKI